VAARELDRDLVEQMAKLMSAGEGFEWEALATWQKDGWRAKASVQILLYREMGRAILS
jgi:hypothetical protein